MTTPRWSLRPALSGDRPFLLQLHRETMKPYIEQVWEWDDAWQTAFFDSRFEPGQWQVIEVEGKAAGLLIVHEASDEVYLADIQVRPGRQGAGIGSAVIASLTERVSASARPLTLRVLHVNVRARALYERLGFRPFRQTETHAYLRWDASGAGTTGTSRECSQA